MDSPVLFPGGLQTTHKVHKLVKRLTLNALVFGGRIKCHHKILLSGGGWVPYPMFESNFWPGPMVDNDVDFKRELEVRLMPRTAAE